MKSGFVGLIGRPNAGKSTLLNTMIGTKIAITSSKPQTTRDNIKGIYHDEGLQIVFVDTPGIHKPKHKLGSYLNREAYYSIEDVDILLLLVDASEKMGRGDAFVLNKLKEIQKPVFLVLNKIDRLTKEEILEKIMQYKDLYSFKEIIPVSALKKDNVKTLLKVIQKYLPDTIAYYEKDTITDVSEEFRLKELLREKILELTEEEVPHSTGCLIEEIEYSRNSYHIRALIVVDRESLKRIIIGKNGSKIKEIGTRARKDMESLLNKKIYLELFVKVIKNWRDREKELIELGYSEKKNFE